MKSSGHSKVVQVLNFYSFYGRGTTAKSNAILIDHNWQMKTTSFALYFFSSSFRSYNQFPLT